MELGEFLLALDDEVWRTGRLGPLGKGLLLVSG